MGPTGPLLGTWNAHGKNEIPFFKTLKTLQGFCCRVLLPRNGVIRNILQGGDARIRTLSWLGLQPPGEPLRRSLSYEPPPPLCREAGADGRTDC